jgi:glucose/arabinose dehydrogenase
MNDKQGRYTLSPNPSSSEGEGNRDRPILPSALKGKGLVWLLLWLLLLAACQGEEPAATPTAAIVPAEPTTAVSVPATNTAAAPVEGTTIEPPATVTTPPDLATAAPAATDAPVATDPPATVPNPQPVTSIHLVPVAGGFDQPIHLTHAFDERLFVVEQPGVIQVVVQGEPLAQPFLDIRERVGSDASEQGLLSVAFHPAYASNGYFYVNYTDVAGDTVVSRFQVSAADANQADPESEYVIIQIEQPYQNHNGGQLQFGPDGYLYIGMGDGGSGGDPEGHGQDPFTLLGDLLRIDVDGGDPYAIPADNPFAGDDDKQGEIWATGLRNPWRFSFDRLTGDLYLADVGQGSWEEINFEAAGSPGGTNYGWNIMEGTHCFRDDGCDTASLLLPVAEYSHDQGCSVTGGYVYRGNDFPSLNGNYFFADYCSGIIWSLLRGGDGRWQQIVLLDSDYLISTFGEDAAGELYLADRSSGTIFQIQP